jgi:allantoinase
VGRRAEVSSGRVPDCDLLIAGARTPEGGQPVDIAIADGVIVAVGPVVDATARERIDARGLLALPGGVDSHVHFNEPGPRTISEGFASGSASLAAGGVTTTLEMPLNARPATTSVEAFDRKLAAVESISRVDFGLWGGIVPGNLEQLEPLAVRGVVGFKAFMSETGVADFEAADDLTLYEAMARVAGLGLPVAVHAENDTITRELTARAVAVGRRSMRDYLDSRPAIAETEAIARAIELAAATGCPLHIVHVSTGRGVAFVAEAAARGLDVTCEVTAHHLVLTEADAERLGALAKCAPPLRPAAESDALWAALGEGRVSFVVSDHAPATPEDRAGDAFSPWGGIAGCQSTLELLLTEDRLTLARLAVAFSTAGAQRFRLAGKGSLEVGADGDVVLVALDDPRILQPDELFSRHRLSPYLGRTLTARVLATILRGRAIYRDGRLVGEPRGRLITPSETP